jgi:hypothetical protein
MALVAAEVSDSSDNEVMIDVAPHANHDSGDDVVMLDSDDDEGDNSIRVDGEHRAAKHAALIHAAEQRRCEAIRLARSGKFGHVFRVSGMQTQAVLEKHNGVSFARQHMQPACLSNAIARFNTFVADPLFNVCV